MGPNRELYFVEGIRYLPRILELVDRNRLSPTYGCFDRSYWHYRTSDFPSGMAQEAVLPLALAYTLEHPENRFYHEERLRELVEAGIEFARRSSHRDGSCDDYFPFERAAGASAFSLYACTEAALILGLSRPEWTPFFKKRAKYLADEGYRESGVLSNHKALIILALYNVFLLTGDPSIKKQAEEKLDHLLTLQTQEGWFPEYGGCDPGYLTFTIDFLAKYHEKSKDPRVMEPLRQAVQFCSCFMHPDGSFGGEYGSRNTFHFLPHGFEICAREVPEARQTADRFLESLKAERRSYAEDDRIFCHYVYNYLQAYLDYALRPEPNPAPGTDSFRVFGEAGLVVKRAGRNYAVISTVKGGVAKIFKEGRLLWCDSGLVGRSKEGIKFTSQVTGAFKTTTEGNKITIEGLCHETHNLLFSPFLFILFRLFLSVVGRFLPANVVRRALQKKAITGRPREFPLRFRKTFRLDAFEPPDYELILEDMKVQIQELWITSDSTFIYVATSQPYQSGTLKPWLNLNEVVTELNEKRQVRFSPKTA